MNPDIDRQADTHDARHREAQEALPWLANNTLAGPELERIQSHLLACAACRADLALMHTLRTAGAEMDLDCNPEHALARLLPRLGPPTPSVPAAPASEAGPAQRWRERIAANDRSWMRVAIVAQCCVIAVLAVLLAGHGSTAGTGSDAYRALGSGAASTARLVVVFRPETPERELRRIVRANGARIVGGPTATNAYLLDTDWDSRAALASLRKEAAVSLVESLVTDGQP